ncbi:LacI family DNA-binding transcriptional regulator [Clostridium septicum]|uniref:LacI family DNA-binding transcriptional regulator n=1 Tax=Clostridium septicum TaxID=1504 RepID=A0A9N7JKN2_CLOSE|nr:LacI family DNA-binding transcriptional regulator [Clostridium septicum]AYE33636.1 LacI family transcriptional regulator [Clostridium septicum]MDU1312818.1 LacI family DNA-binding transcriptional regulator [Clostridium septicum]QAS61800.1 LacI family DNA-binding transcriptional regulator [Clostridium septicum]UEC21751.1 LacI family DNA-binding transcriptional regulator [Clostridium septicum]USS00196.1 LacI family DNA-binding transcriptional regulator [Clostridium septicum]
MTNIYDIAKKSGFSPSTVSRALNNNSRISKETRTIICNIANEMNYVPNNKAISLSTGKSYTLGVIIPYITYNSYYDSIINSIIYESFKMNYRVTFLPTNYQKDIEIDYLKLLSTKEFDGIIISSAANSYDTIEKYLKYGHIVSCEYTDNSSIPSVIIEKTKTYKYILQILKDNNIENIGVTFSRNINSSLNSQNTYSTFCENLINFNEQNTFPNCRTFDDGIKAATYFHKFIPKLQCIFANSDEIASGIYWYFNTHEKKVPIIIGQDNSSISKVLNFSTIDFNLNLLGSEAVKLCISGVKEKKIITATFINRTIFK